MKKLILLSISVFLGLQLVASSSAKAQNFQIVASFGSTQSWGVPASILYEVDYFYPYHRFVHVDRFYRGRNIFFNVLLERHGQFIELTFNPAGNIFNTNYFNNYPLVNHICSGHCGYHRDYYVQQHVVCNAHNHRGHNHVRYVEKPRYSRYSRPTSVTVVNTRHHGHNGHHRDGRGNSNYNGKNRNYQKFDKPRKGDSDKIRDRRDTEKPRFENSDRRESSNSRISSSERDKDRSNSRSSSRSNNNSRSRVQ